MGLRPIILGLIATAAACGGGSLNNGGTAGASGTGTGGVGGNAGTTGVGGNAGTTGVGGTFVVGDAGAGWWDTAGTTGGAPAGSGGAIAGSGGAIAGSGGAIAGSSGTGTGGVGSLPACSGSGGTAAVVELAIAGADNMALTSAVSASVKVTAIDNCATIGCPTVIYGPGQTVQISLSAMETRFVLTAADARTWTLYLRNSAMPGDLVKVNDTFDMTVQAAINQTFYASLNQTIALAHGTDLVLFASALNGFGIPPLPALDAFGVGLTDAGARCEMPPSIGCINRPHAVHVTVGTDFADVPGGTAKIGWLSFTNGGFLERKDTGNCDSKGATTLAGFRTP